MKKKKMLKNTFVIYIFILMISTIFIITNKEIISFITKPDLNVSISEIDTDYGGEAISDNVSTMAYNDPSWIWPTDRNFYLTSTYSWYHPAIDIVPNNHQFFVYSANSGTVVTNSYKYDNGNYLVIKQDEGHYIMYAHLSQKLVNENDHVEKGQTIGVMGSTGFATGIHLHFAVWEGYPHQSKSVNPLSFY